VINLEYSSALGNALDERGMCGIGKCCAYRAALPVAGVINSIAGAWVRACVFGLRPRQRNRRSNIVDNVLQLKNRLTIGGCFLAAVSHLVRNI